MNIFTAAAFFIYFTLLVMIGIFSHRKQKTAADFLVANRSLNFWLTALSAHASDMSSWLFMAFPAAVFISGLDQLWTAFGLILGMFLTWQFVAKKLRIETEKRQAYTLSMFFERRFHDRSGFLSLITASMILFFLTFYLSSGLVAMGLLFETLFHINYYLGLTITVTVVAFYTVLGGFLTVAWTDLFQGIFLFVVILAVPCYSYFSIDGGTEAIIAAAAAKNVTFSLLPDLSFASFLSSFSLMFGWGLGYFGQPHIITKFMGIKNPEELRKAKYLGISWQICVLGGSALVGIIGVKFFDSTAIDPQLVFVQMVQQLFHPFLTGFILCAIFAATISTMDSQILVCSSVISEDFWKRIINKKASPKEILFVSRLAVVFISFVALVLAFNRNETILSIVFYAWSGLGASFGPLVLMALYSPQANRYGAAAGIFTGGATVVLWPYLNPLVTSYTIPAMLPGFILSGAMICLISKLTANKKQTVTDYA